MDRVYLSKELIAAEFHTNTFYIGKLFDIVFLQNIANLDFLYFTLVNILILSFIIKHQPFQFPISCILDHGTAHKLCVMELIKGADDTLLPDQRWIYIRI